MKCRHPKIAPMCSDCPEPDDCTEYHKPIPEYEANKRAPEGTAAHLMTIAILIEQRDRAIRKAELYRSIADYFRKIVYYEF